MVHRALFRRLARLGAVALPLVAAARVLAQTQPMAGPDAAANGVAIEVPMEVLKTRHIAVRAKIDGDRPYRLIVDTGSPITFISSVAAKSLGLIDNHTTGSASIVGMKVGVKLKSMDIGGAVVRDADVMVLDHPTVEMLAQVDGPLDGIVGLNVLGRFAITLDYAARRLTLTPTGYEPKNALAGVAGQLMSRYGGTSHVAPSAFWGVFVEKPDGAPGVRVARVVPKSPAASAGIKAGDRVVTVDRRWTDSLRDCIDAASLVEPGRPAVVRVRRGGVAHDLVVRPVVGF